MPKIVLTISLKLTLWTDTQNQHCETQPILNKCNTTSNIFSDISATHVRRQGDRYFKFIWVRTKSTPPSLKSLIIFSTQFLKSLLKRVHTCSLEVVYIQDYNCTSPGSKHVDHLPVFYVFDIPVYLNACLHCYILVLGKETWKIK